MDAGLSVPLDLLGPHRQIEPADWRYPGVDETSRKATSRSGSVVTASPTGGRQSWQESRLLVFYSFGLYALPRWVCRLRTRLVKLVAAGLKWAPLSLFSAPRENVTAMGARYRPDGCSPGGRRSA